MVYIAKEIEDTYIQLPDGKMHYQSYGSGSPVILLHSMASSVWSWSKVLKPLAKNHTVYALDTMGQGGSDKPAWDYSVKDYATSVVNFMKAKGISKATLVGNSVGAVFSSQIAIAYPTKVDRLVLVGYPYFETEEERKEGIDTSRVYYNEDGIPFPRSFEELKQHYVHISIELQAKVNEDLAKAGIWSWKCMTAMFNFIPVLKNIKANTLLVFGERDILRKKESELLNLIKGSKLIIIPETGHVPQVDDPEAFLKLVGPFIK